MKYRYLIFLLIFFVLLSMAQAKSWEIQLSYGSWSLTPFTTALERESEQLIEDELMRLLNTLYPFSEFVLYTTSVDLSSSGNLASLTLWYNFKETKLSLGLRTDYVKFHLPFTLHSEQSLSWFGWELAKMETQAEGKININSILISLLGRLRLVSEEKVKLYLCWGLSFLQFDGKVYFETLAVLDSPFGDLEYKDVEDHTIDHLRRVYGGIPSYITSPTLGTSLQYRISKDLGIMLNIYFLQGATLAGGLVYTF